MARRRLQVFISSTMADLKEVRKVAIMAVLKAGHVPECMESFSAEGRPPNHVIQRQIEECDAYLVIQATRYGSIDPTTNLSYTEMEYDYAKSKGLPTIAMLPDAKWCKEFDFEVESDDDTTAAKRFRKKLQLDTVAIVSNADQLFSEIGFALTKVENQSPEDAGWIRAKAARAEIADLRNQIAELKAAKTIKDVDESIESASQNYVIPQDQLDEAMRKAYAAILESVKQQDLAAEGSSDRNLMADGAQAAQPIPEPTGGTDTEKMAVDLYNKALIAFREFNYAEAIGLLTGSISLDADSLESYMLRGKANRKMLDQEAALADFQAAVALDDRCAEAYANRGSILALLGRLGEAEADCNRALELDPENAQAWQGLGIITSERGNHVEAIEQYSRAIELDPDHANAYYNRGISKFKLGDNAGALADYNSAIELDSKYAYAYHNRGLSKYKLGDIAGAIEDHNRALEIDPKFAHAYNSRGATRQDLGDYTGAVQDYKRALELDPNHATAKANLKNLQRYL